MEIGYYLRVSKEDGDCEESTSIHNQRGIVTEYAATHFTDYIEQEFIDDGYSGRNLKRPGLQALLKQAECGKINCIIVKDLSRLGRNYIDVGELLEAYFPRRGIRVIGVLDGYDSDEGRKAGFLNSDKWQAVVLKNLMNDFYSKDISVKVREALRIKKEQGLSISAYAPYGYCKSLSDRYALVPKEEEAYIVRFIFLLARQGKCLNEIVDLLEKQKLPSPGAQREEQPKNSKQNILPQQQKTSMSVRHGEKQAADEARQNMLQQQQKNSQSAQPEEKDVDEARQANCEEKRLRWHKATVWNILRNPVYIGDLVYGKYEKDIHTGKIRRKPYAEWKRIPMHHEPLVPIEQFQWVQEHFFNRRGD